MFSFQRVKLNMIKKSDCEFIEQELTHLVNYVCFSNIHPFDAYIGHMIKTYRKAANMTQQQMAFLLDITFQQLQKYEKGTNRISAARLWDVSQALNISYLSFFKGLDAFIQAVKEKKQSVFSRQVLKFKENSINKNTLQLSQDTDDFKDILNQLAELEIKNKEKETDSFSLFQQFNQKDLNDFYAIVSQQLSKSDQETLNSQINTSSNQADIDKLDKLYSDYLANETDFSTVESKLIPLKKSEFSFEEEPQEIIFVHKK